MGALLKKLADRVIFMDAVYSPKKVSEEVFNILKMERTKTF